MIVLVLFVAAAICFIVVATEAPVPRVNLTGLGLALMAIAFALQVGMPK